MLSRVRDWISKPVIVIDRESNIITDFYPSAKVHSLVVDISRVLNST